MKRKLPALLLAILLMLCTVTAVVLTGGASGEDTFDPDTYDYDALYIEGAVFSWHAFDKKEGDALPTDGVLADLSNGMKLTVSKTNANATIAYGDGYLKLWGDTKLVLANAYRQPSTGSSINYTVEYSYATVDVPSAGITDPADTAKNGGALPSWRSGERFFTSKKIDSAVSTDLVRLHATKVAGLESQRLWRNAYNQAASSPASRSTWTGGDNILSSDFTYLQGKETEDGVAAGTYCYLSDKELTSPVGYTIPVGTKMATYEGFQLLIDSSRANSVYYVTNTTETITQLDPRYFLSDIRGDVTSSIMQTHGNAASWACNTTLTNRVLGVNDYGAASTISILTTHTTASDGTYTATIGAASARDSVMIDSRIYSDGWTAEASKWQITSPKSNFTLGSMGSFSQNLYAIRIYEKHLTQAEVAHNKLVDIFHYYGLDPSEFLSFKPTSQQIVATTAAENIALGETTKEEAERIIADAVNSLVETKENEYTELYVPGYTVMINPMTSKLPEVGADVNALADMNGTFYKGSGKAQPTAVEKGVNLGYAGGLKLNGTIPIDDSYTVQMTFSQSADGLPSGLDRADSQKTTIWIGSIEYRCLITSPDVDRTLDGGVSQTVGYTRKKNRETGEGKLDWYESFDFITNNGTLIYDDLFGSPYGEILEFTMTFDVNKEAKTGYIQSYRNGNKVGFPTEKRATIDLNTYQTYDYFYFGLENRNFNLYNVLVYDRVLSEEEIAQNHFANLMAYYNIDLTLFHTILDEKVKTRLYETLRTEQVGIASGDYIQRVVDIYALTGGQLGVIFIEDYLTFEGLQSKIEGEKAVRALFEMNMTNLSKLEALGCELEFGVLYAKASDVESKDDLVLERLDSIGEFVPVSDAVTMQTVYRRGAFTVERLAPTYRTKETVRFAAQLPEGISDEEEYYACAYIAADMNGSSFYFYVNAEGELFGETFSLKEAATYFLYNGFSSEEILASVCGPIDTQTARAVAEIYEKAALDMDYAELMTKLIPAACEGAGKAKDTGTAASEYIGIGKSKNDLIYFGKDAINGKVNALLYAGFGIESYDVAAEKIEEAKTLYTQIYENAYTAAIAAGADEERALQAQRSATFALESRIAKQGNFIEEYASDVDKMREYRDYYNSDSTEAELATAFQPKLRLYVNGTLLLNFTIVTNDEHYAEATRLQETLLAKFGASIGIYNVDNPYIGDEYNFTKKAVFYVGVTDDTVKGKGENAYSVYADGNKVYLEGNSELALSSAVSSFVHKWAHGEKGTIRLTLEKNAEIASVAQPFVTLNFENAFENQITYTSYDAQGVLDMFKQKVAEVPSEITVVSPYDEKNSIATSDITVFVSAKDGNDANEGTIDAPFATIEKAIAHISYRGGGRIFLRGGTYEVKNTITIDKALSGMPGAPTYIGAYNGEEVVFTASLNIDVTKAVPLTFAVNNGTVTEEMLARINCFDKANATKVYVLDMLSLGYTISDLGSVSAKLYMNGETYSVARYPNVGAEDQANGIHNGNIKTYHVGGANDVLKVGKVTNAGSSLYVDYQNAEGGWAICFDETLYKDRLLSYKLGASDHLYTYGAVYEEWWRENREIKLSVDSQGRNVMTSTENCAWGAKENTTSDLYFYNVPEELDAIGEYYIDRETGLLYFIPEHAPGANDELLLASKSTKLFDVQGVHDLVIDGITVTKTLGQGIYVYECENVIVQNCTGTQTGAECVCMANSPYSGIIYCNFRDMNTTTALTLSCTDEGLTRPSYNFVQNNYSDGHMSIGGMNFVFSHNYIDRNYIRATGFDAFVEYNEFNMGSQTSYDNGPIYASGMAGRISLHVRYNSFHDLNFSNYGIYFDDLCTGNYAYGNIIEYAEEKTGNTRGMTIHGGAMNVSFNNIFINAGTAVMPQINYVPKVLNGKGTGGGVFGYRWPNVIPNSAEKMSLFDKDVVAKRFPMHTQWIEWVIKDATDIILREGYDYDRLTETDEPEEIWLRSMLYNVILGNVAVGCGTTVTDVYTLEYMICEKNQAYTSLADIGLTKDANGKFALAENSRLYTDIEGFQPIPFERIGILQK